VAARESPLEGFCRVDVVFLEAKEPLADRGERREVIRREDLALNNGEIDLDLIEPAGMDRGVDEYELRPLGLQPRDGAVARWEEPLSTTQKTRRAERYGCCRITWATSRSKGAMPVAVSQRPNTRARCTSHAAM
jgi:hypothetical protein